MGEVGTIATSEFTIPWTGFSFTYNPDIIFFTWVVILFDPGPFSAGSQDI
ncbi:MAG: hypothetical protein ABH825_03950 [Candidatus Omnitrophota bacterium]